MGWSTYQLVSVPKRNMEHKGTWRWIAVGKEIPKHWTIHPLSNFDTGLRELRRSTSTKWGGIFQPLVEVSSKFSGNGVCWYCHGRALALVSDHWPYSTSVCIPSLKLRRPLQIGGWSRKLPEIFRLRNYESCPRTDKIDFPAQNTHLHHQSIPTIHQCRRCFPKKIRRFFLLTPPWTQDTKVKLPLAKFMEIWLQMIFLFNFGWIFSP